jgi:hypothetical protein
MPLFARDVRVVPPRVHDHDGDLAANDEGHDDHRRADALLLLRHWVCTLF